MIPGEEADAKYTKMALLYRGRSGVTNLSQSPSLATPATLTEEEKIRQRREKLEAWKKKKAEEEEAKKNAPLMTRADSVHTPTPTHHPDASVLSPMRGLTPVSQKSSKP